MVARIFGRHPTLPVEGHLPAFEGATGWLNSTALEPEGLRGKVVAADFCTYTCINWLRTLPYVRAWAEKYRDHGLVTIGVHTPEFAFEHDVENARSLATMRVAYPIALDNEYGVWNAFANHYWPARRQHLISFIPKTRTSNGRASVGAERVTQVVFAETVALSQRSRSISMGQECVRMTATEIAGPERSFG